VIEIDLLISSSRPQRIYVVAVSIVRVIASLPLGVPIGLDVIFEVAE